MAQQYRLGTVHTNVRTENGETIVRYHSTDVVRFSPKRIVLNTGGWRTATTKTRMNQASSQFGLGYHVSQNDGEWFISYNGKKHTLNGHELVLRRKVK